MIISYDLHLPLSARIRLLLGWPLIVSAEGEDIANIKTYVQGTVPRTVFSLEVSTVPDKSEESKP